MDGLSTLKQVGVFLASPGDLSEERRRAAAVIDSINRSHADLGFRLELSVWEDIAPEYGRPQGTINAYVDACYIFIGLLHRRWGTPSGDGFSSGFEEEFHRASERHEATKVPHIMLYFLRIPPEQARDPGPQLQKVLEFKESIRPLGLFQEVDDADAWEERLREDLTRRLVAIAVSDRDRESAAGRASRLPPGEVGSSVVSTASAANAVSQLPAELSSAVQNLIGIASVEDTDGLEGIAAAAEPVDILRLHLASAALLGRATSQDRYPIHAANLCLRERRSINVTVLEAAMLLRSALADDQLTPGWYWPAQLDVDASLFLILFYTQDTNSWTRHQALDLLDKASVPIPDAFAEVFWRSVLTEADDDVRHGARKYAMRHASTEIVSRALGGDELEVGFGPGEATAFRQILRLRDGDVAGVLREVVNEPKLEEALEIELRAKLASVESASLRPAIHSPSKPLGRAAAIELYQRGEIDESDAPLLREASDEFLNGIGLLWLIENSDSPPSLEIIGEEAGSPNHPGLISADRSEAWNALPVSKEELLRKRLSMDSFPELVQRVGWFGIGSEAYWVLAHSHFSAFEDQLRADLREGFQSIRDSYYELISNPLVAEEMAQFDSFISDQFAAAALDALAEHGCADDVEFARAQLDAEYDFLKLPAVKILERFGTREDPEPLLNLAKKSYGETRRRAILTALSLYGDALSSHLDDLLAHSDPSHTRALIAGLTTLGRYEFVDRVAAFLGHEDTNLRMGALTYVIAAVDEDRLEQLLDGYFNETFYYYNVVCWLDRVIYCPEPLRSFFRNKLLSSYGKL